MQQYIFRYIFWMKLLDDESFLILFLMAGPSTFDCFIFFKKL